MLLEHNYEENGIVSVFLSSNIIMSKYIQESEELIIIFKGGTQYIYKNVDLITYIDFVRDDSQGNYLNANMKDKFITEKVDKKVDVTVIKEKIDAYRKSLSK